MKYGDIVKRGMDIVGGAVGTALAAVPMAAVAAGVYLSMGRPVFYVQPRQGKDGQYFNMIKFRSMTNETDTDGNLLPDAQRVTRFGRFIRRTSLDELPQFVNVLKGDMSLVGPRPAYFKVPGEYSERFAVRPGLTGLAQINGRKDCPLAQRMAYDIDYVRNRSVGMDLKILFQTVAAVASGKGTGAKPGMAKPENPEYQMTEVSRLANFRANAMDITTPRTSVGRIADPALTGWTFGP